MNFLKKVQSLPPDKRKIILWAITFLVAAGVLFIFGKNAQRRMENFDKSDLFNKLNISDLQKDVNKVVQENKTPETIFSGAENITQTTTQENNMPGSENSTTAAAEN